MSGRSTASTSYPSAASLLASSHIKDTVQVAPYLTHVVTHHGQVTLIPPENSGRIRKPKKRRSNLRRNDIDNSGSTLELPRSSAAPRRPASSASMNLRPERRRPNLERNVHSEYDVVIPDFPPPSFEEATRSVRSENTPPAAGSRRDSHEISHENDATGSLARGRSTPSTTFSDDVGDVTPGLAGWEEDRLAGIPLEERVRRELDRKRAVEGTPIGGPSTGTPKQSTSLEGGSSIPGDTLSEQAEPLTPCLDSGANGPITYPLAIEPKDKLPDTARPSLGDPSSSSHGSSNQPDIPTDSRPVTALSDEWVLIPKPRNKRSISTKESSLPPIPCINEPDSAAISSVLLSSSSNIHSYSRTSTTSPAIHESDANPGPASTSPSIDPQSSLQSAPTRRPPLPAVRDRISAYEYLIHRPVPPPPPPRTPNRIRHRPPPPLPTCQRSDQSNDAQPLKDNENTHLSHLTSSVVDLNSAVSDNVVQATTGNEDRRSTSNETPVDAITSDTLESPPVPGDVPGAHTRGMASATLSASQEAQTPPSSVQGVSTPQVPEQQRSDNSSRPSPSNAEEHREISTSTRDGNTFAPPGFVPAPLQPMFTGPTDLDLLLARLEDPDVTVNGRSYDDIVMLEEFMGTAASSRHRTHQELLDAVPIGKIEVMRRRVTKDGRKKLKLALLGVVVDKCGICLSQFKEGVDATLLECQHAFHAHCISDWFHRGETCPLCRSTISSTDE